MNKKKSGTKLVLLTQAFKKYKRMNLIKSIVILGSIALLTGCKTPSIIVSDNLKSNTSIMEVKGKQGWQFNQVIKYGDYSTSKIKRSWDLGFNFEFIARFQEATEKLSFVQSTPKLKANVFVVGKFKNTEIDLIEGFLGYPIHYENYFTGVISQLNNDNKWEFILHNPDGGTLGKDFTCGLAKDDNGNEIIIKGVREVENQANWIKLDNFGFEFIMDGKSIGAISNINSGRVWINNQISEELKLVISSISTSLLVRHSLEEQFQE